MDENLKEVYFHQYCKLCNFSDLKEEEDPCRECLQNPMNVYSHKPVMFKPKESSQN